MYLTMSNKFDIFTEFHDTTRNKKMKMRKEKVKGRTENADRNVKHNEARDNSNFHTREKLLLMTFMVTFSLPKK